MNGYANKGYNSTKKLFFYGYKAHCEVSDSGIVLAYSITSGSVHDVNVAKTLLNQYSSPLVLADKGYISKSLKDDLRYKGINLETPSRSNMKSHPKDEAWIVKHRLRVKTTFSQLKSEFNIEHDRGRTTKGYQTRFEQCLLVDTYRKLNQHYGYTVNIDFNGDSSANTTKSSYYQSNSDVSAPTDYHFTDGKNSEPISFSQNGKTYVFNVAKNTNGNNVLYLYFKLLYQFSHRIST